MPTTPELQEPDTDAETNEQIFKECAERLKLAQEIESQNRLLAIEDLEFADGQQWPDDLYNMRKVQRRPTLTINHTGMLVRRVINNMRQQRPRIKVHPVGDADVEETKVANGLIRHIETLSKASVAYDTGGESAVRMGWGYWRIVGEYEDEKSFYQELKIRPVRNALTGYIDPSATMPDGSDMDWFIFSEDMKRTDFHRLYPKEVLRDWSQGGAGDSQNREWAGKYKIRLAEYYRVKKVKDTLLKLSNGTTMFKSEYVKKQFEAAGVFIAKKADGSEDSRPTERRQIQWFRLNGTEVVDQRDLPGHWIPVIRCEGNVFDLNGEVRRKGMIRDLKDPARQFNYWETAKTEKLALSSKAPWVMAAGQSGGRPEWDDANQKPYSKLEYNILMGMDGNPIPGVPPPQRQPPVEVEAGFAEASQSAAKNLMAVAGMPHEPGQDAPGTVVSGVALRRRQALSDISHFQYYDNQTMAIAHTGRILLDQIPYYYGEQRMQRIIGEDGQPQMVQLNEPTTTQGPDGQAINKIKNDMSVGRFDVVMDTGPGYETKRLEGAENMLDLLKTSLADPIAKAGADLVVRNMDFAGADDLADRLMPMNAQGMQKQIQQLPKEAQGIVQSLMTQNQQSQQLIQHLQLELKYKTQIEQGWMQTDVKKAHLAATTKAHDTETRANTAIDVAHINAQSGLADTELQVAGKLMDSHVKGKHDLAKVERQAERAETNGANNE